VRESEERSYTEKSAVGAADNEADRVEVGNTNEAAPAALATRRGGGGRGIMQSYDEMRPVAGG
jgi:hypothetical protein